MGNNYRLQKQIGVFMEKNYSVPNLERSIEIIEYMSREKRDFTITEIARELDFPRNSVFRIVKTLIDRGYMVSLSGKTYRLSSKLLSIGYAAVSEQNLIQQASKPMHELRDQVNESVFIGVMAGSQGVVLDELLSYSPVKVKVGVGTQFPVYTGAPGKAMVAYLDEHRQNEILDQITFKKYTENTITSKKEMIAELIKIREKGFATDHEEMTIGINCVSCPIFNFKNEPFAAIWIGGQSFHLKPEDFDRLGEIVKEYALEISKKNGYLPEIEK